MNVGDLFRRGNFKLRAGASSDWKIDCDALTDDDLGTLAYVLVRHNWVRPFHHVAGVPAGGLRLADALKEYEAKQSHSTGTLVVDDVWTTGTSLLTAMASYQGRTQGAVLFARGRVIGDVVALFTLGYGADA